MTKVFIKVDVTKGLPEESEKYYLTDKGWVYFEKTFRVNPKWWLKEISLSELMIEFMEYYDNGKIQMEKISEESFVSKFLKSKGILTIE